MNRNDDPQIPAAVHISSQSKAAIGDSPAPTSPGPVGGPASFIAARYRRPRTGIPVGDGSTGGRE